jgi:hypothetical protein
MINDAPCILVRMFGLPNPAWISLGNVVYNMGHMTCGKQHDDSTPMCLYNSHDDRNQSSMPIHVGKNACETLTQAGLLAH